MAAASSGMRIISCGSTANSMRAEEAMAAKRVVDLVLMAF